MLFKKCKSKPDEESDESHRRAGSTAALKVFAGTWARTPHWDLHASLLLSRNYFILYMCLEKIQQNFCFFISFDLMHCTSLIHQPAYFKVNNFTLVYVFLSVNHYFVFSWPLIIFSSLSAVHPALSLLQPSTGEKETREGWVKIDTIAADKSFSKVEPSSPHQYQPNRYSRINIKTRSFAPLTRNG